MERLRRFYGCGLYAGKIFCIVIAFAYLVWQFYEWLQPADQIDGAPDWNQFKYVNRQKSGQLTEDIKIELPRKEK